MTSPAADSATPSPDTDPAVAGFSGGATSELVLDVVLLPPPELAASAARESASLAEGMRRIGNPSHFVLGGPLAGGGREAREAREACVPHVSVFMFAATGADLPEVLAALAAVAGETAAVDAVGSRYAHNPHGASELYFELSPAWTDLQRRVVAAFEPIRRGRLRAVDPAGTPIAGVIADRTAANAARRRQLLTYGYDEITDGTDDRFRPHITLAWPERPEPAVELAALPPAHGVRVTFDQLAVYGMSPWGTCTTAVGVARTRGRRLPAPAAPPRA